MQESITFIKTELQKIYPSNEVQSLLFRILESVCNMNMQSVLLGKDKQLSPNEKSRIWEIVENLKDYRPIQYILGETEFYGLKFKLTEDVLIPRPETEELVEWITDSLRDNSDSEKLSGTVRVLDIGTGSGCIAVSLGKSNPDAKVFALDFSADIIALAEQNAKLNDMDIDFIQMDILKEEPVGRWDVLVSNPPYVVPSEKELMSANVLKHEPHSALFVPEENPLLFYKRIADIGLKCLKKNGFLFFEINPLFSLEMFLMLKEKGYRDIEIKKDISGKDRMMKAVL